LISIKLGLLTVIGASFRSWFLAQTSQGYRYGLPERRD
jgi:hypothetical protein